MGFRQVVARWPRGEGPTGYRWPRLRKKGKRRVRTGRWYRPVMGDRLDTTAREDAGLGRAMGVRKKKQLLSYAEGVVSEIGTAPSRRVRQHRDHVRLKPAKSYSSTL